MVVLAQGQHASLPPPTLTPPFVAFLFYIIRLFGMEGKQVHTLRLHCLTSLSALTTLLTILTQKRMHTFCSQAHQTLAKRGSGVPDLHPIPWHLNSMESNTVENEHILNTMHR